MTKWFRSQAKAALKRERQRPTLSPQHNGLIGAAIGTAVPIAVLIRDHHYSPTPYYAYPELPGELGFVAYLGGVGLVCSQRGWRGLALATVGTAAIMAPIGGFKPDPITGENWQDTAVFGALVGPVVWLTIRALIRVV